MRYRANRGGHVPGYLRAAFCMQHPPKRNLFIGMSLGVLLFLLGFGVPLVGAWEGKTNNKAAGDLARMGDAELCTEAVDVCLHSAQPGTGMAMEGLDYLAVIRQAAQKKHGETVPSWLEEVATAIAKHDPQQCPTATCPLLQGK
jgi:hypothetical protein